MSEWILLSREWVNMKFKEINVEEIQKKVDQYDKAANMCAINMKDNPVTGIFKEKVDEIKSTMPVVTYLRDEALKERHWEEIYETVGIKLDLQNDEFTLKSLMELNVKKDKDKLGEIALKANKEQELEDSFKRIQDLWRRCSIEVKPHKDNYYIIGGNEELNALLEESMVTLSNILGARFVDNIRADVETYYKKLQYIENLLNEW